MFYCKYGDLFFLDLIMYKNNVLFLEVLKWMFLIFRFFFKFFKLFLIIWFWIIIKRLLNVNFGYSLLKILVLLVLLLVLIIKLYFLFFEFIK